MPIKLPSFRARRDVYPPDLWTKCPSCETMLFNKQLDKAHAGLPDLRPPLPAVGRRRASSSCSTRSRGPSATPASSRSTRSASSTRSRTRTAWRRPRPPTGMRDAAVWGTGAIGGIAVAICVMDFGFMGGSMGAVVGEKVTRAAEHALAERIPLVVVSASGGARMQEGTLALMQLAKTLAAIERLRAGRRPVHLRPERPDDRRRVRLVRRGRRRQPRRAERAHRVRRRARLRRHDRAGAAAGLPARRVPVQPRVRRPRRRPRRAARRAGATPAAAAGPRRGDRRVEPAAAGPARRSGRCRSSSTLRRPRRRAARSATASADPATAPAQRPATAGTRRLERTRPTAPGPGSSWPATCAGRGRSSSSAR